MKVNIISILVKITLVIEGYNMERLKIDRKQSMILLALIILLILHITFFRLSVNS